MDNYDTAHKLPWKLSNREELGIFTGLPRYYISDAKGKEFLGFGDSDVLLDIIRCVNSHDDLVTALTGLLADIVDYQAINNLGGESNHWQIKARQALIRAGVML